MATQDVENAVSQNESSVMSDTGFDEKSAEEKHTSEEVQNIEIENDEKIQNIEQSNKNEQEEPRIKNEEDNINYHSEPDSRGNRRRDDLYPVIQVEEKTKSNVNGLIIGFSGGMFLASILLVVFVFMYGIKAEDKSVRVSSEVIQQDEMQRNQQSIDDNQLIAIQKERDAALAVTRGLERERDAALAAAKAQQEMRAAEMRAAEIIAEQERSAAREVRRAKERARQAELNAAKSKEREKLALEKVEIARLKAEKIKLEKEMERIEASKIEEAREMSSKVSIVPPTTKAVGSNSVILANELPAENSNEMKKEESDSNKKNKFIRNPCDSPSAKFLSTCKK